MKQKLRLMMTMLFLTLLGGMNTAWAETSTIDMSTGTNGSSLDGVVITTDFGTLTYGKGNATNPPAFYTSGSAVRFYAGNTITLNAGSNTITKVDLYNTESQVFGAQAFSVNGTYSLSNKVETWQGSTNELIITSSNKPRLTKIVVTFTQSTTPTVATPTFSLEEGTYYNEAQNVEISTTTDGATIYYTLNGDDPTTSSSEYSEAITIDETTTIKAIAVKEGMNNSAVASATYTIIFGDIESWVETSLADLTEDDVFVIVGNNGNNYAMSNDNGTGNPPSAIAVNIEDNYLIDIIPDNIKWTISGNANDGYTFYPNGNSDKWLYCTNTNNGVRVGTNSNKTFKISEGYLNHVGTTRYVGIYISQDWRCYESINTNIAGQTFKFYKKPTEGTELANPQLSFSESSVTAEVGVEFTAPTLTYAEGFEGTIVYESSNPEVATVDASTGEVTIVAAGETIISATSEPYGNFKDGSASYTLTVIDPNAPGTINNPYTVAQARAAIDANTGLTGVYVTGIVSEIVTEYNSQYGNISYNISADGTTTTDQLQAFRGKSYNGVNFTSVDDIQVGDVVVVYGNLTTYGDIYELAADNQLVSLVRPVVPSHDVTFSANGTTFSTTTAKEGANIEFPTENPTDVGDFKFIGWSTADWTGEVNDRPTTLVTSATMGTEDMTIYAVYALATEGTGVRWKKVEENAITDAGTYAILTYQENYPNDYYAFNGTVNSSGHGVLTSEYISFDSEGYSRSMPHGTCELTFEKNGTGFIISNADNKYLYAKGTTSGNLAWSTTQPDGYWSYNEDSWKYSNGAFLRGYDGATIRTYSYINHQNILFAQKVGGITYSYYCTLVGNYEIVDFTTAGYKSYVTANAIDWVATKAKGVEGYQVTEFSTGGVTLVELDGKITAAETPVILKGVKGKNLLVIANENSSVILTDNKLKKGSDRTQYFENKIYVLQKSQNPKWSEDDPYNNYNFYPLNKTRYDQILDRQAFLILEEANGGPTGDEGSAGSPGVQPAQIPIRFIHANDDDPMVSDDAGIIDGINGVEKVGVNGEFYSISGVRIAAPTKGLYIVNGKKVLVK